MHRLSPIERCERVAGLAPHEMLLGVSPGERHARLLVRYRRARRSRALMRNEVVADLRAALGRGAKGEAADLLIVLRLLLAVEGIKGFQGSRRIRPALRPRLSIVARGQQKKN